MAPLSELPPRASTVEGSVQTTFLMPLAILVIFTTAWVVRNPVEARQRLATARQCVIASTAAVSVHVHGSWRAYMCRTWARCRPGRVPTPVIHAPIGNESTGPLHLPGDSPSPIEMEEVSIGHLTSTGASFQPTQHERRQSSLLRNRASCSSLRVRAYDDTDEPQTIEPLPAVAVAALLPPALTTPREMVPVRLSIVETFRAQGTARSEPAAHILEPAETARESGLPSFPRVPQHPLLSEEERSIRVNDTQPESLAAPLALLAA